MASVVTPTATPSRDTDVGEVVLWGLAVVLIVVGLAGAVRFATAHDIAAPVAVGGGLLACLGAWFAPVPTIHRRQSEAPRAPAEQTTLVYEPGSLSAGELQRGFDAVLEELRDPLSPVGAEAAEEGLDLAALATTTVRVEAGAEGLSPEMAALVITLGGSFSPAVAAVLMSRLILPRIRRRYGADALGDQRDLV